MWNPFKKKIEAPLVPNYPELCKQVTINDSAIISLKTLNQKTYKPNIERYKTVFNATGVPTDLICALHYREASNSWNTYLHNGDPLGKKTTHVPSGIGPFYKWEEAAIDSLLMDKHNFPNEWTFENKLAFAEKYNGIGYRKHGILSPYVFAATNLYTVGLFVEDGKFSMTKKDERLGVASILIELNRV